MNQEENPTYNMWIGIEPYAIGAHSYISEFTHISQYTTIGKFCSIANLCTIGAQNHALTTLTSFPFDEVLTVKGKPLDTVVGNDVWIGCNTVIMEGVTVGDGAAIGAGTVVTKDVPPYAIVVGSPGRVLRYRFDPRTIARLLKAKWWDLPVGVIRSLPVRNVAQCLDQIELMKS